MRLPNSYGSVIKLSGRRRKRYAVRISSGYKTRICVPNKAECYKYVDRYSMSFRKSHNDYVTDSSDLIKKVLDRNGIPYRLEFIRRFKYLQYFSTAKEAYAYLAKMNAGEAVTEHTSLASEPSFKDVYTQYVDFMRSLKKPPSETTIRSWDTGFKSWKPLHHMRFRTITTQQIQKAITAKADLSRSSVGRMMTVLRSMYKYAIANDLCDRDLTPYIFAEHTDSEEEKHRPFTDDEIKHLWKHSSHDMAKATLIMIYTGIRCGEFLQMYKSDVHLDESYMVGGIKTPAGKGRTIPIHDDIKPLIQHFMDTQPGNRLYYSVEKGDVKTTSHFDRDDWRPFINSIGLEHLTHDCRHTCATKMEQAGISDLHQKLILGHDIKDITRGVYTHVDKSYLIADINRTYEHGLYITCISQIEKSG